MACSCGPAPTVAVGTCLATTSRKPRPFADQPLPPWPPPPPFALAPPQVNLDFESEADMVEKTRIGIALQPVATALFANSPFKEGKPTGYLSWRSHVWTDTDPDRCGPMGAP